LGELFGASLDGFGDLAEAGADAEPGFLVGLGEGTLKLAEAADVGDGSHMFRVRWCPRRTGCSGPA
jgi:hypothetical protein